MPILKGDEAFGMIGTYGQHENAFDESDVRLLQTLANSMSVALENARLFDETQRRSRETAALAEVGRDISATLDLGAVMDRIARHAKDLLHADNSAIFLPDAGGRTYRAIVAIGGVAEAIKATVIESGIGIIGSLLAAGRAEFINDTGSDPRAVQIPGTDRQTDERLMVAPFLAGKAVKGAMAVVAHRRTSVRRHRARVPDGPLAAGDGRDRERAAVQRDEGGARAADRDRRSAEGDQRIADRRAAGVRRDRRARDDAVRRAHRCVLTRFDGELVHLAAFHGASTEADASDAQRLFR